MRRFVSTELVLDEHVELTVTDSIANHLQNVLRLAANDVIELCDGRGLSCLATVNSVKPLVVTTQEIRRHPEVRELTLVVGIIKKDRWEWMLEKATEVGVTGILPITTERGVVDIPLRKIDDRLSRWRRICENAARQCGRYWVPDIDAPDTFDTALKIPMNHVYGSIDGPTDHPEIADPIALWIGPEGGFSPEELEKLAEVGTGFRFSNNVLRAETAAIVGAAALLRP